MAGTLKSVLPTEDGLVLLALPLPNLDLSLLIRSSKWETLGCPKGFKIPVSCPKALQMCHTQLLPNVPMSPPDLKPDTPRSLVAVPDSSPIALPPAVSQPVGTSVLWYGNSPDIWPSGRGGPKPMGIQRQLQTILDIFGATIGFSRRTYTRISSRISRGQRLL